MNEFDLRQAQHNSTVLSALKGFNALQVDHVHAGHVVGFKIGGNQFYAAFGRNESGKWTRSALIYLERTMREGGPPTFHKIGRVYVKYQRGRGRIGDANAVHHAHETLTHVPWGKKPDDAPEMNPFPLDERLEGQQNRPEFERALTHHLNKVGIALIEQEMVPNFLHAGHNFVFNPEESSDSSSARSISGEIRVIERRLGGRERWHRIASATIHLLPRADRVKNIEFHDFNYEPEEQWE